MVIIVSENPEPENPIRQEFNIEVRFMIKGATENEGERIGEAIREVVKALRPNQRLRAFKMDQENAVAIKV